MKIDKQIKFCNNPKPCYEGEEWRDAPSSPDRYEVSNQGRIRCKVDRKRQDNNTLIHKAGSIVPQMYQHGNYLVAYIYPSDNDASLLIFPHKEVARAFIPEHKGTVVTHINGIREDNRVENLLWVTDKERANITKLHNLTFWLGSVDKEKRAYFRGIIDNFYYNYMEMIKDGE